jgi:maltodextrin utilization protein YvdJ
MTETHDNVAAWPGIGSALVQPCNQKAVPASLIGVLSTFLYLASVLILHITTPALFSLETFNASRPVFVNTHGLPSFN